MSKADAQYLIEGEGILRTNQDGHHVIHTETFHGWETDYDV